MGKLDRLFYNGYTIALSGTVLARRGISSRHHSNKDGLDYALKNIIHVENVKLKLESVKNTTSQLPLPSPRVNANSNSSEMSSVRKSKADDQVPAPLNPNLSEVSYKSYNQRFKETSVPKSEFKQLLALNIRNRWLRSDLTWKRLNKRDMRKGKCRTDAVGKILVDFRPEKFKALKRIAACPNSDTFPEPSGPEFVFIGRSNAGKSTMINDLTSSRPCTARNYNGVTTSFNFYNLLGRYKRNNNSKISDNPNVVGRILDCPGYGSANASEESINDWNNTLKAYIEAKRPVRKIFVLVDARTGIKKMDKDFLDYLDTLPKHDSVKYQVVLTKADFFVSPASLTKMIVMATNDIKGRPNAIQKIITYSTKCPTTKELLRAEINSAL